ncbi:nicotinate-nucleotide adenylyltransferase [Euzebya sp.]|uniref:nicotinate-nucleotide adenylyltransferase n=1 Tax=Euzebya sp. TaxID=1971409 RepID=UPI0035164EAF
MARRLGIMGGTFDPIHMGHLVTAEQARVDVGLDEVVFVPAGAPWQKSGGRAVSAGEHRYLMTVLATAANPFFSVSRIEIDRGGPTYTVETLRSLRASLTDTELFFITGADAILNILTWKDAGEAVDLASFVAATRPGYDLAALEEHDLTRQVTLLDVPALAISSSDVRARFEAGRPVRYLIPREVEEFARKHGLYGTHGQGLAAADVGVS